MAEFDGTIWDELIQSASLHEERTITGAILLVRAKDLDTGTVSIHIGCTEEADYFVQLGLLEAAKQIVTHNGSED